MLGLETEPSFMLRDFREVVAKLLQAVPPGRDGKGYVGYLGKKEK